MPAHPTTTALFILLVLPVNAFPTSILSNTSIKDTDSTSLPFDSANNLKDRFCPRSL
jgi:hypothetical protein